MTDNKITPENVNPNMLYELGSPQFEAQEKLFEYKKLDSLKKGSLLHKFLKMLIDSPEELQKTDIMDKLKIEKRSLSNLIYTLNHQKKIHVISTLTTCKIEHETKSKQHSEQSEQLQKQPEQPRQKRKYTLRNSSCSKKLQSILSQNPQGLSVKELIVKMKSPRSSIYSTAYRLRKQGVEIEMKNDVYTLTPTSSSNLLPVSQKTQTKMNKEIDKLPDMTNIVNKLSDIPISEQKDALHHLKHGIFNLKVVQAILDSNGYVKNLEAQLKKGWID